MKSFNYFIQQVWVLIKLPFRMLNSAINGLDKATALADTFIEEFNADAKTYEASRKARLAAFEADEP